MKKLGIVYDSQELLAKLRVKSKNKRLPVGLIFEPTQGDRKRLLKISRLYYEKQAGRQELQSMLEEELSINETSYIGESLDRSTSVLTEKLSRVDLSKAIYDVWGEAEKPGIVFFGKAQLEALCGESPQVLVSRAFIEPDTGLYEYPKQSYATLKAEAFPNTHYDTYISDIIFGMPCPPFWKQDVGNLLATNYVDEQD